jgi:hypothetical protein
VSLLSLFKIRFTNWINRSQIANFFKIFQSSQQSRIILDSSFHWGFLIHCIYVNDDKLTMYNTKRGYILLLRNKILAKMQRTEGSWIHFKFPFNEKLKKNWKYILLLQRSIGTWKYVPDGTNTMLRLYSIDHTKQLLTMNIFKTISFVTKRGRKLLLKSN